MVNDPLDCVRRLGEVAGLAPQERRSFDWQAIEQGLGLRLPGDYKALAELFPRGWFRMFAMVEPPADKGRFLTDDAVMGLEYLRQVRASRESPFPFPVFPERGGVLPWGAIRSPGQAYWLTGPGDPDDWPVITATETGDHWERYDGPACQFLTEVAAGRYDASGFPDLYQESGGDWAHRIDLAERPVFTPVPATQTAVPAAPSPGQIAAMQADAWPAQGRLLRRRGRPANVIAELRGLIGPPPAEVSAVDWADVHVRAGFRLPADYREFVDAYGPGTLGDIRIMAPGQPPEMDLFGLLDRKHAEASGALMPFYPDPGGTVSWGETPSGYTCAWGPTDDDPDQWIAVVMDPPLLGYSTRADLSFSSLLADHVRQDPGKTRLMRDPGAGPVTFTPYRQP